MLKKILFLSVIFSSCKDNSTVSIKKYADLKGLFENQISILNKTKPSVTKTWAIGGKTETKSTNDIDWEKELSLFKEADINKSAYLKSYDSLISDDKTIYSLKKSENLPIKRIEIVGNMIPSHISILSKTDNYLFKSTSEYKIDFSDKKVKNYSVFTVQKMFFGKPDSSKIIGKIN